MSEQGYKRKGNGISPLATFEEDEESRRLLSESKKYMSERQEYIYLREKMPSINESFNNRGESWSGDEVLKEQHAEDVIEYRSSKTSDLEGDDIYNSSPRIKTDGSKEIKFGHRDNDDGTLSSNHGSFLIRPEHSRNLPQEKSSSLISSSRTSVGFLKDFYFQLVELIKYRNLEKLKHELTENDDVYEPVDMTKKILLHYACEFNSLEICRLIFEWLFFENPERTNINPRDWVNSTNNDGLSAIHFAAYRGNNELIEYLISLGADVHATDKDGHNCIHIAAQSDKINTIYFLLKNYKFDINQGDKKLSTALHWAAFLNKENALTYLLAWGADPNLQDIDNNTPLHLSVILSCRTGNTRNVKLLLLKGASRDVRNNDSYRPIDLVNTDVNKAGELRSLLQKPTVLSWCMLKPPLSKLQKNENTVIFFLVLLTILIVLSFFYVIPTFESLAITICSGVGAISILITFGFVTLRDPGYLKKDPAVNFQELLNTLDPLDICPECEIILTPRCRHCNIWNKWVERFDHHWPYVNNWVGYNNHVHFLFYITSLGVNLVFQFVLAVLALVFRDRAGESIISDMKNVPMFYASASVIAAITGLFVIPVLFLVFVHMTNFAKNKTTNERFSKQKINNTSLTTKMTNNADREKGDTPSLLDTVEFQSFMGVQRRNCFSNCLSMCDYRPPSQLELQNEIMRDD